MSARAVAERTEGKRDAPRGVLVRKTWEKTRGMTVPSSRSCNGMNARPESMTYDTKLRARGRTSARVLESRLASGCPTSLAEEQ